MVYHWSFIKAAEYLFLALPGLPVVQAAPACAAKMGLRFTLMLFVSS